MRSAPHGGVRVSGPSYPPEVHVPLLCERHRYDLVRKQLKLRSEDPWLATEVTAQIGLFQAGAADDRIWKRADGDTNNLSLVMAEIGCLACYLPPAYDRVVVLLKKGLSHAAAVVQGKLTDPDWPYLTPKEQEPST